jgi:hypothetical protein
MTTNQIAAPALSVTEWKAVAIALNDAERHRLAGPRKLSKFWKVVEAFTGIEHVRPLADPRLEALRSFVCTVRRTRQRDERMVPALIAQGFNRAQVDALTLLSA